MSTLLLYQQRKFTMVGVTAMNKKKTTRENTEMQHEVTTRKMVTRTELNERVDEKSQDGRYRRQKLKRDNYLTYWAEHESWEANMIWMFSHVFKENIDQLIFSQFSPIKTLFKINLYFPGWLQIGYCK